MDKEFKAVVAATMKDKQNDYFTTKSLRKMAGKNLFLPIYDNFDVTKNIGRVTELEFKNGLLIATIELDKKYN